MPKIEQTVQRTFSSSLGDASQILRLIDFLPDIFLYLKDTQGPFAAFNSSLVRLRGAKIAHELPRKKDLEIHSTFWGRPFQLEDRQVLESGRRFKIKLGSSPEGTASLLHLS